MNENTKECPICKKNLPVNEKLLGVDAQSEWDQLHAKCDTCAIGISNSNDPQKGSLIWETKEKNMISQSEADTKRLNKIIEKSMNTGNSASKAKGMKHENSEDALTWNIFSYLEKYDLLNQAYKYFTGERDEVSGCQVYYWGSVVSQRFL